MNVVVVLTRGLRADFLGCYGNLWIGTPAFDALAATGILFDNHSADLVEREPISRELRDALRAAGRPVWLVHDGRRALTSDYRAGWDRILDPADGDPLDETLYAAEKALK